MQNSSLILYLLLFITLVIYIFYRATIIKKTRIEKATILFKKLNYIDLEIGLLEGNDMDNTENKD